jgi:uncharacterized SAM-binding protein YcdF (DUF218 family)
MTTLKRALEFCFSPLGILTFLLLGGLVMTGLRRTSKTGRRMVWAGVWIFLLFLLTPLAELIVANLEQPYVPMQQAEAAAGVRSVVVLSGASEDHVLLPVTSKLGTDTMARTVEGIRLYRQRPGARLIVAGGVLRTGDRPVAEMMADFAIALGVPRGDLVLERSSRTTYENLREVKKIIGAEPFILVNSALDLRRATAVARKLGMKPVPAPAAIWAAHHYSADLTWKAWGWRVVADLRPSPGRLNYLQWAAHEYLGYGWYWMLGRT